jgi:hypothetical protein
VEDVLRKDRKARGSDGRRNNVTPEHGKIRDGEVRNPWGAGGKPKIGPLTSMDDLFWEEAARIVSHDSNGPVDARKRLVQEEFLAALKDGDSAVRARLLCQLHDVSRRKEQQKGELHSFVIERKARLTEQFDLAQKLGQPAPDILPHPDHVEIRGNQLHFRGPTDRRGRAAWEMIKTAIRVAACLHEITRDEYRRTGSPAVLADLKTIKKDRGRLMRKVPKGWNWREEIYCRDSTLTFVKETVRELKEIGYVPSDAGN